MTSGGNRNPYILCNSANITLTGLLDNNVWRDNGVQGIFLTVLHLVIDLGILSYALVKLIKYTLNKRTTISVAQVSLVLIILAMCGM